MCIYSKKRLCYLKMSCVVLCLIDLGVSKGPSVVPSAIVARVCVGRCSPRMGHCTTLLPIALNKQCSLTTVILSKHNMLLWSEITLTITSLLDVVIMYVSGLNRKSNTWKWLMEKRNNDTVFANYFIWFTLSVHVS